MNDAFTVDHLTEWSLLEWWLHYLGAIAVPALAIVLVVAAYRACRAIDRLSLPNPVEAAVGVGLVAGAFAVVFLGLNWHIELLYGRYGTSRARPGLSWPASAPRSCWPQLPWSWHSSWALPGGAGSP